MRMLLSGCVSGLVMFALAGLYTGVLARSFIAAHVEPALLRTPPNFPLLIAGYVMLGLIMSWAYSRVTLPVGSPLWRGLCFGWAVAVLWLMPYSLVLFGVYHFPYEALPLDFAWAFVEQGIGGILVAVMHDKWGRGRRA